MQIKKKYDGKTGEELINALEKLTLRNAELEIAQKYFDIAGVMLVGLDNNGNVSAVNKKACDVLGYEEREIRGKNWFDHFIPPRIKNELLTVAEKLLHGEIESVEYYENPVLTRNGEERFIAWHNAFIKDETGQITGHIGSGEDITEARRAEAALRQSEEKYRTVVENANEAIFIAQDWVLKFCNPKTIEMLGFTQEELQNKPFAELIHPDDRAMVVDRHRRRLQGQRVEDAYAFKIISKDLRVKWIEIKPLLISWEGRPATLNFMSDIKNRKREEEERKKLEAQLLHSKKMEAMGTLAGGIAHDFNNILGAILGYTELSINELSEDSAVRANLEYVLSAANRAKDLVKQILAFSRKADQEKKPVYLGNIVKETIKLLRSTLPTTIEIRFKIADGLNPIMADPTRLHQVMMNLCTNAGHAMRENGGLLEITLEEIALEADAIKGKELEPGFYQRLTVSDTGHGMDAETQRRIFDPYFTTKKEGEGTGMGLSVAHGIIKSHKGEITVYSEPGKGTTFHVLLPETEIKAVPETAPQAPIQRGNERILLVDDEWALVELGKQMLQRIGYTVEVKNSSMSALEAFRSNPSAFDLIITDQTMPGMTGIQLARQIKELRPEIPVILCTGFSEAVDEENFKSRGIDAFVMKPMVMRDISQVIRKVLAGERRG
jgi:PAS domain S-box-containing protein